MKKICVLLTFVVLSLIAGDAYAKKCELCSGTGKSNCFVCAGSGRAAMGACYICGGSGKDKCVGCNGTGNFKVPSNPGPGPGPGPTPDYKDPTPKNEAICKYCSGSGVCSSCNGSGGHWEDTGYYTAKEQYSWINCGSCSGKKRCFACNGKGKIRF